MKNKNIRLFKICMAVLAFVIIVGAIIVLFPVMKNLSTSEGQIEFKTKVNSMGIWGMLALFGLQVAQIFLVVVPGEPIEILAGMCYGPVVGTVFIMFSSFIVSTTIFFLVRIFGVRLVNEFYDKKKIEKITNSKLYKNPKKIELIMIILFIIPGTPKDLLCYIAGLLPIKPLAFILISTFARFPSVISSTIAGEKFAVGNWKMAFFVYGIIFIIVGVLIAIIKHHDKDNIIEESIETFK